MQAHNARRAGVPVKVLCYGLGAALALSVLFVLLVGLMILDNDVVSGGDFLVRYAPLLGVAQDPPFYGRSCVVLWRLYVFCFWFGMLAGISSLCFCWVLHGLSVYSSLLHGVAAAATNFVLFIVVCWYVHYNSPLVYTLLLVPCYPLAAVAVMRARHDKGALLRLGVSLAGLCLAFPTGIALTQQFSAAEVQRRNVIGEACGVQRFQDFIKAETPVCTNTWSNRTLYVMTWDAPVAEEGTAVALSPDILRCVENSGFTAVTSPPPNTLAVAREELYAPGIGVGTPVTIAPGIVACRSFHFMGSINSAGGWKIYVCFGRYVVLLFDTIQFLT